MSRGILLSAAACACLAFYLALLWLFWPGMYNMDSNYQWDHASGRFPFDDHHPPLFAIFMMPWARTGSSVTGFLIAQILAVVAAMTWSLNAVIDMGVRKRWALLIPAAFILIPTIPLYTITVYKDVYYSVAVLVMTVVLVRANEHGGKWARKDLFIFLCFALLAALLRHNGAPVAIMGVAAAAMTGRFTRRTRALILAGFLAVFLITKKTINSVLAVYPRTATELLLPHHLAAHLSAGNITNPDDLAVLDRLRPTGDDWSYDCTNISPTMWWHPFDRDEAARLAKPLWTIFIKTALRNPMTEIKHLLCASQMVWNPFLPVRNAIPFLITPDDLQYVSPNEFGFVEASKNLPLARRVATFYASIEHWGINQPSWYLYVMLLAAGVAYRRTRQWQVLVPMVPVVVQSLFLAITVPDQEVRYQLPVYFIFPVLMLSYGRLIRLNARKTAASDGR